MNIVVKRRARKTVSISIDVKGNISVLCPYKYSNKNINKLLEEKKQWIQATISKINDKLINNQDFYLYKKIMFLGETYEIVDKGKFLLIGEHSIKKNINSNIKNVVKKWLISQANSVIIKRLDIISNYTNVNYKEATIGSARKKWGSCNSLKCINLNFRLISLPIFCIDYVCLHELMHINQMNHSKNFWLSVEKFCPNYKQIKAFMIQNSFVLELF